MGAERPKAFVDLAGKPLLLHAALAFEASPSVTGLVAVVPAAEADAARTLLAPLSKLLAVAPGGDRRQDSVLEGLKQVPEGFTGIVLVHDAARPLVETALIEEVTRAAEETGAALPMLAVVDTVKRVREGRVVETLDRSEFWAPRPGHAPNELAAAQTPQGFRFDLLVSAYEAAFRNRLPLTDEAMAVERIGAPVKVVPGSTRNRKITTSEDLAWAEGLLQAAVRT